MQAAESVITIGEQEIFHHKKKNLPIIDPQKRATMGEVGSTNIPYDELTGRMDELDENHPSIFFCNGPQCPQSSAVIKNLLEAGYPADKILRWVI